MSLTAQSLRESTKKCSTRIRSHFGSSQFCPIGRSFHGCGTHTGVLFTGTHTGCEPHMGGHRAALVIRRPDGTDIFVNECDLAAHFLTEVARLSAMSSVAVPPDLAQRTAVLAAGLEVQKEMNEVAKYPFHSLGTALRATHSHLPPTVREAVKTVKNATNVAKHRWSEVSVVNPEALPVKNTFIHLDEFVENASTNASERSCQSAPAMVNISNDMNEPALGEKAATHRPPDFFDLSDGVHASTQTDTAVETKRNAGDCPEKLGKPLVLRSQPCHKCDSREDTVRKLGKHWCEKCFNRQFG